MQYLEKSHNGYQEIHIKTKQLDQGVIYLTGTIHTDAAIDITEQLLYLEAKPQINRIILLINSPGGSVSDGLLIYDQIRQSKKPVITVCIGKAMSMAAILLASGHRRYILPHSKVMIHEPLIEQTGGSATSISKTADSILDVKRELVNILVEHTKRTKKQIEKAISFDNTMTAEESVQFGLCDEILLQSVYSLIEG